MQRKHWKQQEQTEQARHHHEREHGDSTPLGDVHGNRARA
jgi:hypothetical protein